MRNPEQTRRTTHHGRAPAEAPPDAAGLNGLPETLLIPLWARAAETGAPRPIIRDPIAERLVARIAAEAGHDFTKYRKARLTRVGVRTMLLDRAARAFLRAEPDAVVVTLAAGLDTRRQRLAPHTPPWYDLDLPEVMALRTELLEEDGNIPIAASMFDSAWMDRVDDAGRPVLLLAEGVLMYFPPERVKALLQALARRFPGAMLLLELLAPFLVGRGKRHESLKLTESKPEFLWGPKDCREMQQWVPGLEVLDVWNLIDFHKRRWGAFGRMARLPGLRRPLAQRIARLRLPAGD